MNMMVRVIAKMACSSRELMAGSDLQYYLTWLKDQLKAPVRKLKVLLKRLRLF